MTLRPRILDLARNRAGAVVALQEVQTVESKAAFKRNVKGAIESVAARLGNTATICRKCYVHPEVLQAYAQGELLLQVKASIDDELRTDLPKLTPEEAAVLALLEARVSRTLKDKLQDSVALLRKSKRNGKIPAKRHNVRNQAASAHQVLH